MKRLSALIYACTISSGLASSTVPESTELFPEIKGWKLILNERVYVPSDLWDMIDGAADTYLSYSFVDLHLADYENDAGINVRVELYRHSTFNNTFGIYTAERSPDYNFIEIGSQGYLEEGALNFLCGYYYVKITTGSKGDDAQNSLLEIAKQIEVQLNQEKYWPGIFQIFPPDALPYSDHYIAENFLGFDFLNSAFIADYNRDGKSFQVFIIKTDDPVTVREMLAKYLKFAKQDDQVSDRPFKIHDPYNGDIDVILKGNTLAGIINCENETIRQEYIGFLSEQL